MASPDIERLRRFRAHLASGDVAALFLRGAGGILAVQVASAGLLFLYQILLARVLGVESYGIFLVAYAWAAILMIPARQGFDQATVRYASEYNSHGDWPRLRGFFRFTRRVVLASSCAIAAVMAIGAWLLRARIGEDMLWAFWFAAVNLPIHAQLQTREAALRGLGYVVRSNIVAYVLHPTILILVMIALLIGLAPNIGRTADTAMAAYLGATAVTFAMLCLLLRQKLPDALRAVRPATEVREWLGASFAMMFLMSFGPILKQISLIIIGTLNGNEAAGQYGAAMRISYAMQPLLVAQHVAMAPIVARLFKQGGHDEIQRVATLGGRLVFAVSLAMAAIMVLFGEPILGLMGEDFVSAYPLLVVLACGRVAFAAAGPALTLLNMTGHHGVSARILAYSAGVNLALSALLIPRFGAMGAAVAMALTMAIWGVLMAVAAGRCLGIRSFVARPRPALSSPRG